MTLGSLAFLSLPLNTPQDTHFIENERRATKKKKV